MIGNQKIHLDIKTTYAIILIEIIIVEKQTPSFQQNKADDGFCYQEIGDRKMNGLICPYCNSENTIPVDENTLEEKR